MEIVIIPHPSLRKISKDVSVKEIPSAKFQKLLENLSVAMATRDDGVGLSAPQIAVNERVFVVSGKIWKKDGKPTPADEYFINPVVVKKSKKLVVAEEGCLSIPNIYGLVKRHASVSIDYFDATGKSMTKKATGLLARIFQHEIDHLDGILFTDKATSLRKAKDDDTNTEL